MPIQSEDSIQEEPQISPKTSAVEDIMRVLDEFRINDNIINTQQNPAICGLTSDKFAVVWESLGPDPDYWCVYTSVFSATTGQNLTNEVRANHYTTSNQLRPSICAISNDSYAVAWKSYGQDTPTSEGVYARIFNATTGENITSEFQVNHSTISDQAYPSMCLLSNDNLLIAWHSNHIGSQFDIYARVFNTTTGQNVSAEFRVNEFTPSHQRYSSACALSNNRFAVAWQSWQQDVGSTYGTYVRVFNGTTCENITKELRLNHETADDQQIPVISTITDDTFVGAWQSLNQDGSSYGIYMRGFNATTATNYTLERLANQETNGAQADPAICTLSDDYYVVTWLSSSQDTSGTGIFARIMNATTAMGLANESQVNQEILNDQRNPSICALSNTSFAVVWESSHTGNTEIYATVYGLKAPGAALPGGGDDDDDDDDDDLSGIIIISIIVIASVAAAAVIVVLIKKKR